MTEAKRIKDWIRCGGCSHKLMKVEWWNISEKTDIQLEIKCHSCKTLNKLRLNFEKLA